MTVVLLVLYVIVKQYIYTTIYSIYNCPKVRVTLSHCHAFQLAFSFDILPDRILLLRAMERLEFPRMRVHNGRGFRIVQLTPEEMAGWRDVSRIFQTPENKPLPFDD